MRLMTNRLLGRYRISLIFLLMFVSGPSISLGQDKAGSLPSVNASTVRIADPGSPLPTDWSHGAFIEIYVRAYQDSNGDGIGDLRGLIQRLDYLKSLGVKGIWLMPITASGDGDHGYAVKDYRNIEPAYGNLADFDELVKQAHSRGIGIVLDYLINHASSQHPAFINAASSPISLYRDWFVWQETAPKGWDIYGRNPWVSTYNGAYLAQFNDSMPDFNLLNPKVINFHLNNMRFWLNRGADGFRFDAVAHLIENGKDAWYDQPGNYVMMNLLIKELGTYYPNRYMVCEAPESAKLYAAPTACGHAFAFPYQYDLVKAAKGDRSAMKKIAAYFGPTDNHLASFVSNHDQFAGDRLWNQVGGNLAQYRLVAATYLLQPGTPFIFYGEEVGMGNHQALAPDARLRIPMSWSNDTKGFSTNTPFRPYANNIAAQNAFAELEDADSILTFYKSMLGLRNNYPSIAKGIYQFAFAEGDVLGFQRKLDTETTLILINYGKNGLGVKVKNLLPSKTFSLIYPKVALDISSDAKGVATVTLPAQSVSVFIQK
jgi:alpha-amylase